MLTIRFPTNFPIYITVTQFIGLKSASSLQLVSKLIASAGYFLELLLVAGIVIQLKVISNLNRPTHTYTMEIHNISHMPYVALYVHGSTHAYCRAAFVLNTGYDRWRHAVVVSLQEERFRNDPKRRSGAGWPEQMAPRSAFQFTSVVWILERRGQIRSSSFFQNTRPKIKLKVVVLHEAEFVYVPRKLKGGRGNLFRV